ncbi:MAG: leucine-rich repeat protein [Paludibacteraceae bacterium]|nr:leucine-rich repeat protein [Paludibacteraceae bacterium]
MELPNSLNSIGNYAFLGSKLVSILIPNSVTNIGEAAFRNCKDLEICNLPDS